MKTLIIGANGQIGRQFCELAQRGGMAIRAMIRHPDQQGWFHGRGIETVIADLEGKLRHAFNGCDQVIFTAGSGPHTGADKTLMIDLYGAIRATDHAVERGLERFIMISALRASDPLAAPEALRPYMAAKFAADAYLRAARIPHVILKPGRLNDEPATRMVSTSQAHAATLEISRSNVAHTLVYLSQARMLKNREFDLLDGESSIAMALL